MQPSRAFADDMRAQSSLFDEAPTSACVEAIGATTQWVARSVGAERSHDTPTPLRGMLQRCLPPPLLRYTKPAKRLAHAGFRQTRARTQRALEAAAPIAAACRPQ
ncbi:hypothetical protein [Cupriavidus sp. IDO]|uniref:hypothetical protein n=1 Tax=Cupriavidus sp. IDO TaxID=1539142 RepID=UPI0005793D67|nr:hypothetical protein [Cupriavidus sp. IDO]KWR75705.1 hypothetical protein RM96_33830 [Cupriavidus sp. IDO]